MMVLIIVRKLTYLLTLDDDEKRTSENSENTRQLPHSKLNARRVIFLSFNF